VREVTKVTKVKKVKKVKTASFFFLFFFFDLRAETTLEVRMSPPLSCVVAVVQIRERGEIMIGDWIMRK